MHGTLPNSPLQILTRKDASLDRRLARTRRHLVAITLDDLTVNFNHLDREALLSEWRWLIGPRKQPILVAAIGDAYLQDPDDGTVHLLDVGGGALEQIAASVDEFRELLGDRDFVTDAFVPSTIVALRNEGKTLAAGQVYSYVKPPVLGGTYSTSNLEPTDVSVHFSILGQIHRQVKDFPEGTPVSSITIA
jgi:hypothetical protein